VWNREGGRGFYKGLAPNLVRVLPSACVTFVVYENARWYLPSVLGAAEDRGGEE
jgi:solute carrier family 25 folate transporter 32